MIVLPKAGANTIGAQITGIGLGLAQAAVIDAISSAEIITGATGAIVAGENLGG